MRVIEGAGSSFAKGAVLAAAAAYCARPHYRCAVDRCRALGRAGMARTRGNDRMLWARGESCRAGKYSHRSFPRALARVLCVHKMRNITMASCLNVSPRLFVCLLACFKEMRGNQKGARAGLRLCFLSSAQPYRRLMWRLFIASSDAPDNKKILPIRAKRLIRLGHGHRAPQDAHGVSTGLSNLLRTC